MKRITSLIRRRQTQVRNCRVLSREFHSCENLNIPGVKTTNPNTKLHSTMQSSSQLWRNFHLRCEVVRPKCRNILQSRAVHSCEKVAIPCVKTTNPSIRNCIVLSRIVHNCGEIPTTGMTSSDPSAEMHSTI